MEQCWSLCHIPNGLEATQKHCAARHTTKSARPGLLWPLQTYGLDLEKNAAHGGPRRSKEDPKKIPRLSKMIQEDPKNIPR